MDELKEAVRGRALSLGFDIVGFAAAEPFLRDAQVAIERLRRGLMGDLPWYTEAWVHRGANPQVLLPGARSLISLGMSYWDREGERSALSHQQSASPTPHPRTQDEEGAVETAGRNEASSQAGLRGRVARYAWGRDYHNLMRQRLKALARALPAMAGRPVRTRWYVDDGPMMDRAVARRAGVGWQGKNTLVLSSTHGSYIFLGQILTELELEPDEPLKKTCGRCTLCIKACPTGAFIAPYVLDSTRCISYLTIEHRGPIPSDLRPLMGDWVFGCDICQEVCPVNRKAPGTGEPDFQQRRFTALELTGLLALTEEEFQSRFQGSPVRRATREGLQRNACVALGNLGDTAAVPMLARTLRGGMPLVRGHAAWALGRIGGTEARAALEAARMAEGDPAVQEEIEAALADPYVAPAPMAGRDATPGDTPGGPTNSMNTSPNQELHSRTGLH